MQPPRQEIEEEHSKRGVGVGGSRKKVQFHKPNYFWDGGEKNITAITAPGMRGGKEREVVERQETAGRRKEEGGGRSQTKGAAQLSKSSNMYAHISKQSDTLLA